MRWLWIALAGAAVIALVSYGHVLQRSSTQNAAATANAGGYRTERNAALGFEFKYPNHLTSIAPREGMNFEASTTARQPIVLVAARSLDSLGIQWRRPTEALDAILDETFGREAHYSKNGAIPQVIGDNPGYREEYYYLESAERGARGLHGTAFLTKAPGGPYFFLFVVRDNGVGDDVDLAPLFASIRFYDARGSVLSDNVKSVRSTTCYHLQSGSTDLERIALWFPSIAQLADQLPSTWQFADACQSDEVRSLYTVTASRRLSSTVEAQQLEASTKRLFPTLWQEAVGSDQGVFEFFLFADHPVHLVTSTGTIEIGRTTLRPISSTVWSQALAGCLFESLDVHTGIAVIACGGGDNGCYRQERASFQLKDGKGRNIGVCSKNCDLSENEPESLVCTE